MLHSVTFALTTFLAATLTGAVPAPAPQTSAIPPICQVIPLGSPAVVCLGQSLSCRNLPNARASLGYVGTAIPASRTGTD